MNKKVKIQLFATLILLSVAGWLAYDLFSPVKHQSTSSEAQSPLSQTEINNESVSADGSVHRTVHVPPPERVTVDAYQDQASVVLDLPSAELAELRKRLEKRDLEAQIALLEQDIWKAKQRNKSVQKFDEFVKPDNTHNVVEQAGTTPSIKASPKKTAFDLVTIAQLDRNHQVLNVEGQYFRVQKGAQIANFKVVQVSLSNKTIKILSDSGKVRLLSAVFQESLPDVINPSSDEENPSDEHGEDDA